MLGAPFLKQSETSEEMEVARRRYGSFPEARNWGMTAEDLRGGLIAATNLALL